MVQGGELWVESRVGAQGLTDIGWSRKEASNLKKENKEIGGLSDMIEHKEEKS